MQVKTFISRKWNGDEAATDLMEQVQADGTTKVRFCMLFATIHYAENSGLQKLTKQIWTRLSEPKLIGGTVAGFATLAGCFARGTLLVTFTGDDFDVRVGKGDNTKRDPIRAVQMLSKEIKDQPTANKYANRILFEFIAGPTVPELPFLKRARILKNEVINFFATKLSWLFLRVLQNGVGREEEAFQELVQQFSDATIIGGSTLDKNNLARSFQFYGPQVFRNSVVGALIESELVTEINTTYGLKPVGIEFEVTKKAGEDRIIQEIDGSPATPAYFAKLRWSLRDVNERLYRRTFHYTVGFEENGVLFPEVIGAVYGNALYCGYKLRSNRLQALVSDGKTLVQSVENNLDPVAGKNVQFAFFSSCSSRLETLGAKLFTTKKIIEQKLNGAPFAVVYLGGEDSYSPKHAARHTNYTFNSAVFVKKD